LTSFSNFFLSAAQKAKDPDEKDKIFRLRRIAIDEVHLVNAGANKQTFLIRKDEGATMKTADMIPGATGIKNSAGVVVTKADAMAGADEDLQKLIEKMAKEGSGSPEGLVDSLKNISKVLASVAQKAEEPPMEEDPPAEEPPPAEEDDTEKGAAAPAPAAKAEGEGVEAAVAKAAPADPFKTIDDQLERIQKAEREINRGTIATKAVEVLQKIAGGLGIEEKRVIQEKLVNIAKSLGDAPAPAKIPDGNSKPGEHPVKPPQDGGWDLYQDINEKK